LPIPGVDSKWVEKRQSLILSLLNTPAQDGPTDLSTALLLRRPPNRVRMRVLCQGLRAQIGGLSDLEAPLNDLASLPIQPSTVLVVENVASGLALPERTGPVVVFGLGYAVDLLGEIPWLRRGAVVYWGDIDTHGFACLARARKYVEDLKSMLMDESTLMAHRDMWVNEPDQSRAENLDGLDSSERSLYQDLRAQRFGRNVRLEQERIPWNVVIAALNRSTCSEG
jgi:hypothetical protein